MGRRILVAFDFDHTVVDGNTDTWILRALPEGLPEQLKDSYEDGKWTEYMGRVLSYLHSQGVLPDDLKLQLLNMSLTPGMDSLLQCLGTSDLFDCIIISDSNSLFIEWILEGWQLASVFGHVITNPAELSVPGMITVKPFHSHNCACCPVNLCKTEALTAYLQSKQQQGVLYSRIAYVGDGSNDVCPCSSLGEGDVAFPRVGFALEKKLKEAAPKCRVQSWSTADKILQALKQVGAES